MRDGFECVIGWSIENNKFIRPVTNVAGNSWIFYSWLQIPVCDFRFKSQRCNLSTQKWRYNCWSNSCSIGQHCSHLGCPRCACEYWKPNLVRLWGQFLTFLLPELFMKENTSLKGRNALQLGFFNAIWEILWCSKIRLTCRDVGSFRCMTFLWKHRTKMPY